MRMRIRAALTGGVLSTTKSETAGIQESVSHAGLLRAIDDVCQGLLQLVQGLLAWRRPDESPGCVRLGFVIDPERYP